MRNGHAALVPDVAPRDWMLVHDAARPCLSSELLGTLLSLGVALRLSDLDVRGRSPDEGVYTDQAIAASHEGVDGIRRLVGEYNANEKAWIYPPPIRIGYIFVDFLFITIYGRIGFQTAQKTSHFFVTHF